MRITLAQLEAFFWTAELGSVNKAAAHLNMTQPTISLRLRDLREVVGVDLFDRTAKGLRVTGDGRSLFLQVSRVFAELQKIKGISHGGEVVGEVRIGLAEDFSVICLPLIHEVLRRDYPLLRVKLVIATSAGLENDLVQGLVDIAVLVMPIGNDKLRYHPLGIQPTRWVVPAAWSIPDEVTPGDLWQCPIITNPAPSAMYRQIVDWFAPAGLEPGNISLCSSVVVTAEMVAAGIGISVMPVKMAAPYVAAGKVRIVSAAPLVRNGEVYACHRIGLVDSKIAAVLASIDNALSNLDYLEKLPG